MGVLKKYLGLFGFCVLIIGLKAQVPFNVAYHEKSENVNQSPCLISIYNDSYFASVSLNAENFYYQNLYRYGSNGQLKLRKANFIPYEPYDLIKTLDNKLLFVGNEVACDVPPQNPKNFITKLDTNGSVLFQNSFTEGQGNICRHVIQFSDSTYYAFTDSIVYHYDKNGQFLYRKGSGLTNISSVLLHPNGYILISAKKNNSASLCKMNTSGSVTATFSQWDLYSQMRLYSGNNILGRSSLGQLYKVSNSFNILGIGTFQNISDFEVFNDTIYVIMPNFPAETYFITDTTFNVIHTNSATYDGIKQHAINCTPGMTQVLMSAISNSTPSQPINNYVTLSAFNKFAGITIANDISIVGVKEDTLYATVQGFYPINNPSFTTYELSFKGKIKIRNNGSAPLTNFRLNAFKLPDISCGSYYFQQTYTISPLSQGDSVEITIPLLQQVRWENAAPQATLNAPFCIFVSIPNEKADSYRLDNEMCKVFSFSTNYVSVKENSLIGNVTNIYPNPFTSNINIESDQQIINIKLTDQLGRIIFDIHIGAKNTELKLKDIENGIYFLKIETEKGTQLKKVMKQ